MRRALHCGGSPDRRQPSDQALAGHVHLRPGWCLCPTRLPRKGTREAAGSDHAAQRHDQRRRQYLAQHHQAPGPGPAVGWHRSPRCLNRRQTEQRLRVGDLWWSTGNLARHPARCRLEREVMQAGQDERPRLRFSRISIARCADPGPLPRVFPGLSRDSQSTPARERTPPAKVPRVRDLWPPAPAAVQAGCGRWHRRLAYTPGRWSAPAGRQAAAAPRWHRAISPRPSSQAYAAGANCCTGGVGEGAGEPGQRVRNR